MPHKNTASNPAPGTKDVEKLRGGTDADADCPPPGQCADDFEPKADLPGKTDSGPEPDVFPVTKDP